MGQRDAGDRPLSAAAFGKRPNGDGVRQHRDDQAAAGRSRGSGRLSLEGCRLSPQVSRGERRLEVDPPDGAVHVQVFVALLPFVCSKEELRLES